MNEWIHLGPDDLRDWRMERGLSRRQLSMLFRVPTSTIRAFERGNEIPPEWLQDTMATTILTEAVPAISVPRARHRRHRWSRKLTGDDLYRWRRQVSLTQVQAAGVLGCSPASVSAWERNERAPDHETQRQLRERIEGYDDGTFPSRPEAEAPAPQMIQTTNLNEESTMNATANTPATPVTEESARRRADAVMQRIDSVRMPERMDGCRWGREDGFVVIRSSVTGAYYLIESASGHFFRTVTPKTTKIQSDSPRGVVHQDREWLYPLLEKLPEGRQTVLRYHHTTSEQPKPSVAAAMQTAAHQPAQPYVFDLKPTVEETRRVEITRYGRLPIRPDHLLEMLRAAKVQVPPNFEIHSIENGTVILRWPLGTEVVDENDPRLLEGPHTS